MFVASHRLIRRVARGVPQVDGRVVQPDVRLGTLVGRGAGETGDRARARIPGRRRGARVADELKRAAAAAIVTGGADRSACDRAAASSTTSGAGRSTPSSPRPYAS